MIKDLDKIRYSQKGNDQNDIEQLKFNLNSAFKIKDLGNLKYFLGLEVARSKVGIYLSQRKYTLDLLSDCGFLVAKPTPTPMVKTTLLAHNDSYKDITRYRRLVGRLLYLTNTKPDINYAVQQLSQFMSCLTTMHYKAAVRVMKYLKNSLDKGFSIHLIPLYN